MNTMTHKQHPRARFIPREDGMEGAWEHADPEPRVPIKVPLHWWSNWKGLARRDWLIRDTRLVRTTDETIKAWGDAFVQSHLVFIPCNDECVACFEYRESVQTHERELWDVLEERMQNSDPKTAYQIAAGMSMEMHNAMPNHERDYEFKMETAFKDRFYYIYTHWFGSPMKPTRKVFY